jgi:hypothetical protein
MTVSVSEVYSFLLTEATLEQLDVFTRAIASRRKVVQPNQPKAQPTPTMGVGSRVVTSGRLSPQYMIGLSGVIVKMNQKTARVEFDRPLPGRFSNNRENVVVVPLSCLTLQGEASTATRQPGQRPGLAQWTADTI